MSEYKLAPWEVGLRIIVVVLGLLIVLVMALIIVAFLNKKSQRNAVPTQPQSVVQPMEPSSAVPPSQPSLSGFGDVDVAIESGTRIVDAELTGNILVIRGDGPAGAQIILFDVEKGAEAGRVRLVVE